MPTRPIWGGNFNRGIDVYYPTPFRWKDATIELDPVMVVQFRDSGVPKWMFLEWLERMFPPGTLRRDVLEARAYDNVHDTKTSEDFPHMEFPEFDFIA